MTKELYKELKNLNIKNSVFCNLLDKAYNASDINISDELGWTLLGYAIYNEMDITELLLENGANPNVIVNGEPIINIAIDRRDIGTPELLIEHGADINIQNWCGETPLMRAIKSYIIDNVKLLIEHGANPYIKDSFGNDALDIAHSFGDLEAIGLLNNYVSKYKNKIIDNTTNKGISVELALELAKSKCEISSSSFTKLLDKVLDKNDLNLRDEGGWTLLHYLTFHEYDDIKLFEMLLVQGLNPNLQDVNGNTVLHIAVNYCKYKKIKLLIKYGADANIKNKSGITPFEIAKKYKNTKAIELMSDNSVRIIKKFLEDHGEKSLDQQLEGDKLKSPNDLLEEARDTFEKILKK